MNQNYNQLQRQFPGLGCWLLVLGFLWIVGAIGLKGLIGSLLVVILFIVLAPVLAFIALQLWIKRNLTEGNCPVCDQSLVGLRDAKLLCPNCSTELLVTQTGFERFAGEGIIDVQAVDVPSSAAGSSAAEKTIDVEVQSLPEAES